MDKVRIGIVGVANMGVGHMNRDGGTGYRMRHQPPAGGQRCSGARSKSILYSAQLKFENRRAGGLDLFSPIDRRYPHRLKKERKKMTARHLSRACGITIL
jgi:hypothetical protein